MHVCIITEHYSFAHVFSLSLLMVCDQRGKSIRILKAWKLSNDRNANGNCGAGNGAKWPGQGRTCGWDSTAHMTGLNAVTHWVKPNGNTHWFLCTGTKCSRHLKRKLELSSSGKNRRQLEKWENGLKANNLLSILMKVSGIMTQVQHSL